MLERVEVGRCLTRLEQLFEDVEGGETVEISMHGKPVAVVVPIAEYERMVALANG